MKGTRKTIFIFIVVLDLRKHIRKENWTRDLTKPWMLELRVTFLN